MSANPAAPTGAPPASMRSLSRAIQIFEQLQRYQHPQRLKTIADDCGMSSPTALRILRVLCDSGLVSQVDKNYRLGSAILPAARAFLETDPLPQAARPVLARLASSTGFTASLYRRLGYERILIEREVSSSSLGYELPQGRRLPLTMGAAGRVLIDGWEEGDLGLLVEESRRLKYENPEFSVQELRARGASDGDDFAYSADERQIGVASVAVPVPVVSGLPVESISLTAPHLEVGRDALVARVPELRQAAQKIAQDLAVARY